MNDQRRRVEEEYFRLKGRLSTGRITRAQFEAALKELMFQDAQGRHWAIDADGKWLVYDGRQWVSASPPTPSAPLPPLLARTSAPGEGGGGRGRGGEALPILVAAGVVAGLCLIGVVGMLLASSRGFLQVAAIKPSDTPLPTLAPLPSATPIVIVVASSPTSSSTATATTQPTPPAASATPSPTRQATRTPTRQPTPTATPTREATPRPTMLYSLALSDDFDNPGIFVETAPYEQFYESQEFIVRLLRDDYTAVADRKEPVVSDFTFEVDARIVEGDERAAAGIAFRRKDYRNYYAFWFNARGEYGLRKIVNGVTLKLGTAETWTLSPHIQKGKVTNRLKVSARGPEISIFANGQLLLTVQDTSFSQGLIGFDAEAIKGSTPTKAAFDNLILTRTATTPPSVLLQDDFSSKASGWSEWRTTGQVAYEDGEYRVRVLLSENQILGPCSNCNFADLRLEVDARLIEGNADADLRIIFRAKDAANYYLLVVNGQGEYGLIKMVAKEAKLLTAMNWVQSPALKTGRVPNHLTVVASGPELAVYANGELLTRVVDTTFEKGLIGLGASRGQGGTVMAAFDNLRVGVPAR